MNRYYLIFVFPFIVFAFLLLFLNFIFVRVSVGEDTYYFKTNSSLEKIVNDKINAYKQSDHEIVIDGKSIYFKTSDFGINIANNQLSGISLNSKNSLINNLKNNFTAGFAGFEPTYTVDLPIFFQKSEDIFNKLEIKLKNANIVFIKGSYEIVPEENGLVIDRVKFNSEFNNKVKSLSQEPILIAKVSEQAKYGKEQFKAALDKLNILENQSLSLVFNFERWDFTNEFPKLLNFAPKGRQNFFYSEVDFGSNVITFNDFYLKERYSNDVDIVLDDQKTKIYLASIAKSVDRPTFDATMKFENGRVSEFIPAKDGLSLNVDQTINLISEEISTDSSSSDKVMEISLPVSVTKAKIANKEINDLGVRELIASGVSFYAGSIPNRAYNVALGARRLSGVLVAPGEEFSFNRAVGEVSSATGYREAYVISSGRTVLDDGGGICQVSSTVFRAALNSGFPITARTAHAYRVGYYEQGGFKPGFDATIWQPSVDLKFKNDTLHHVLVQAVVDPSKAKLQIDIYGTKDERKVEISQPVISNVRPAPEPKYQDDPTLPKGVVKQVDFAASGANSVFTRKVFRNDETPQEETFRSNFRPWQAVFLVGTGT